MIIDSIVLQNFRSYKKRIFHFSSNITIILGPNTVGKTNILEALYTVATSKSFRAEKDADMIFWDEEVGRVVARIQEEESKEKKIHEDVKLEIVLTHGVVQGQKAQTKKYVVNGVPRRLVDFISNVYAVHFCPEDLDLVTNSPSLRRSYLNTVLSQTDREYRRNLMSYERGLRQRNILLDRIADGYATRSQLFFWDQLLIKTGSYITDKRRAYIEAVNLYEIDDLHYKILYDPSIISKERLIQYKNEEIASRNTLVGPQRDDFSFQKTPGERENQKSKKETVEIDISRFGSRGEQRLAVLWLKLAELQYIEKATGEKPVLLLDDIFSELDEHSRQLVLRIINNQQTILTSAEEIVLALFKNIQEKEIIQLGSPVVQ